VGARWIGTDGIEIELIVLNGRSTLRVSWVGGRNRYTVAYCRSVAELSRYVDLADLVEVVPIAERRKSSSRSA
jgi:hypothetical protein